MGRVSEFHAAIRSDLFASPTVEGVAALLKQRRFVILQGAPGTGKTRMAEQVRRAHFRGRGMTVQFHPAVTYEDFVVGLSPDASDKNLRFDVKRGWLINAANAADEAPFVLEHGQIVGRLVYEKMSERPETLYGREIASNYQGQGLKLAKQFKAG